jgi:membrane-bound lytic murein transglycosylase A
MRLLMALACCWLLGCRQPGVPGGDAPGPPPGLERIPPTDIPRATDDLALDGLGAALDNSIAYYSRVPPERRIRFGPDHYPVSHLLASCRRLKGLLAAGASTEVLNQQIHSAFRVYCVNGDPRSQPVLVTGYYEPLISGSRSRSQRFRFPVYGRPADMISVDLSQFGDRYQGRIVGRRTGDTLVPFPDRHGIEIGGQLPRNTPILAWVDDRIDLFFLHIQGSGRIQLAEGGMMNILYHGTNGHPYRSIGKLLIDRGWIPREEMSMQTIRRYLAEHPDAVDEILAHNPSYVFFRTGEGGPFGSLGVPVTPGRSIATDHKVFPSGAPALMVTRIPVIDGDGNVDRWREVQRLVVNQDTGGAIRGGTRADLFFGAGNYAEIAAGHMQHPGQLFFFVLDPEAP